VEDHIARSIAQSERSGELKAAKSFGKPLDFGDGYQDTPEEYRMAFKILKDAGYFPPEIELMREIEVLKKELAGAISAEESAAKIARLSDLRQKLALLMERLRSRS
jgi:hypothetical protein